MQFYYMYINNVKHNIYFAIYVTGLQVSVYKTIFRPIKST